jgi:hypothetical protein
MGLALTTIYFLQAFIYFLHKIFVDQKEWLPFISHWEIKTNIIVLKPKTCL